MSVGKQDIPFLLKLIVVSVYMRIWGARSIVVASFLLRKPIIRISVINLAKCGIAILLVIWVYYYLLFIRIIGVIRQMEKGKTQTLTTA